MTPLWLPAHFYICFCHDWFCLLSIHPAFSISPCFPCAKTNKLHLLLLSFELQQIVCHYQQGHLPILLHSTSAAKQWFSGTITWNKHGVHCQSCHLCMFSSWFEQRSIGLLKVRQCYELLLGYCTHESSLFSSAWWTPNFSREDYYSSLSLQLKKISSWFLTQMLYLETSSQNMEGWLCQMYTHILRHIIVCVLQNIYIIIYCETTIGSHQRIQTTGWLHSQMRLHTWGKAITPREKKWLEKEEWNPNRGKERKITLLKWTLGNQLLLKKESLTPRLMERGCLLCALIINIVVVTLLQIVSRSTKSHQILLPPGLLLGSISPSTESYKIQHDGSFNNHEWNEC